MIPKQLKDIEFRFFLIPRGKKIPLEKQWNSKNNYPFFHSKLLSHLKRGGNYGICTGYGDVIVLDFDDYDYYLSLRERLPFTFSVISGTKRAPHYFYILKGEMFKKIGIDDEKGKRICDIQASKCGIVAPESSVGRKYYEVYRNERYPEGREIAEITMEQLKMIFPQIEGRIKKPTEYTGTKKIDLKAVEHTISILLKHNIKRTSERHFKCPLHPSENGKCLYVFDDGLLHCFHCNFHGTVHQLIDELKK